MGLPQTHREDAEEWSGKQAMEFIILVGDGQGKAIVQEFTV